MLWVYWLYITFIDYSVRFDVQQRQAQMAASCFAFKLSLFAGRGFTPAAFAQFVNRMRTAQMQGVLAEFPSQFIRGIVDISYFFRLHGIIKKRVLNEVILLQIKKNNSGSAVNILRAVAGIEKIMNDA